MKLNRLLMIAVSASMLIGQESETVPTIYPPPVTEPARALREYLNLTAPQVTALQEVQKSKRDSEQVIFEELRQKHVALENLVRSGSTDYNQIGRLTVELRELQKKIPVSGEPYRTRALSVLSAEQRAKLPVLVNALTLQWPANEAVTWNLVDQPNVPQDPIILPALERRGAGLTRR